MEQAARANVVGLGALEDLEGPHAGLAGSRGVADLRPATRDPGRNQRPAPRDPERPGPGPGLARYTTRDPSRRRPPDARTPGSLTRRDPA